jgi:hypothetical protein
MSRLPGQCPLSHQHRRVCEDGHWCRLEPAPSVFAIDLHRAESSRLVTAKRVDRAIGEAIQRDHHIVGDVTLRPGRATRNR